MIGLGIVSPVVDIAPGTLAEIRFNVSRQREYEARTPRFCRPGSRSV